MILCLYYNIFSALIKVMPYNYIRKNAIIKNKRKPMYKTIIFYLHGNPLPHIAFKNLLGNILFFIPFGFLLPVLLSKINSAKNILIASATFSLLLELLQIFLHLGSFDIDDIFLNTVGALIGYLVALKIFTPKKQT